MTGRRLDLLAVAAAAGVAAWVLLSTPAPAAGLVAGIVLCLVLPGYAMAAAALAGTQVGAAERIVAALLSGLGFLAVAAVALHFSPAGLTLRSWTLLLVAVVLAACLVAAARRARRPRRPGDGHRRAGAEVPALLVMLPGYAVTVATFARHSLGRSTSIASLALLGLAAAAAAAAAIGVLSAREAAAVWMAAFALLVAAALAAPRLGAATITLLVVAGLAVTGGVWLSRTPLPAKEVLGYTQMWLLPAESSEPGALRVGVNSAETRSHAYRLEVDFGGTAPPVRAQFVLAPGRRWERHLAPPAPPVLLPNRPPLVEPIAARSVTATLYRLDRPTVPYRRTTAALPPR